MNASARILLFTGDGKGKTTAALGMALRASGHAMPTLILQFIKNDSTTGEIDAIAGLPNVEIRQVGRGFVPKPEDPRYREHASAARDGLAIAAEAIESGKYSLIILDEICLAVGKGLLAEDDVLDAIGRAGPDACIVMTGRQATHGLIAAADTVTEMRCIKHGLETGRKAQDGVER